MKMQQKFKQLEGKLNALVLPVEEQADPHHKSKVRTLQQYIGKLQSRYEEEGILYDHKVNAMFDHLRRIEHLVKDTTNELEIEDNTWNTRVAKLEKAVRKQTDKLGKERKEADKKIQSSLESYLIELTTFKGKAANTCTASIRELKQLEKEVDLLEKEVKRESQLSKDIYRKIYSQFAAQTEQTGASLVSEERSRQAEEERLFESIVGMYNRLSAGVAEGRRQREKQEKDIVELLERVIEKLKYQILND